MFLTTVWSLMIPPVKFSLYFYKQREPVINIESICENKDKTYIQVCEVNYYTKQQYLN